jgi:hypothetical protein
MAAMMQTTSSLLLLMPNLSVKSKDTPCSLNEVPVEIRERSQFLADEALSMIENGASTAEVRAWLNEQEGMVEIMSDDLALRFRLEGGRGTWILRKEALADPGPPAPASVVLGVEASASVILREEAPADQATPAPAFVVGQNTKPKSALVLSPPVLGFRKQRGRGAGGCDPFQHPRV